MKSVHFFKELEFNCFDCSQMDVNVTTTELVWEETTSVTSPTSHTDPPVSSNDRSLLYILLPIFAVVLVATFSVAVSFWL